MTRKKEKERKKDRKTERQKDREKELVLKKLKIRWTTEMAMKKMMTCSCFLCVSLRRSRSD
jgi:hypothetical protein